MFRTKLKTMVVCVLMGCSILAPNVTYAFTSELALPEIIDAPPEEQQPQQTETEASQVHFNNSTLEMPEILDKPDGIPINQDNSLMVPEEIMSPQPDKATLGIDRPEGEDLDPATNIDDFKWNLANEQTSISLNMNRSITRFEIFYSAGSPLPEIIFIDASGNYYQVGIDNDVIETRDKNQIPGHSDLRYAVVYIKSPELTSGWTAQISVDSSLHEFMFAKTSVPTGWDSLTEEYRTAPEELLLWGLRYSEYNESGLFAVIENVDYKPETNYLTTADAPTPPQINYTKIIVILFIIFLIVVGVAFTLNKQKTIKESERAKAKRINKRNNNLHNRKNHENSHLEDFFKDEDFSDDDYFKDNPTMDDVEDLRIPIEKRTAFVEEEPEEDYRKNYTENSDEMKEDSVPPQKELPSWLLQ